MEFSNILSHPPEIARSQENAIPLPAPVGPVGEAHQFWSPQKELLARVQHRRPRRSSAGADLDSLVSAQYAARRKEASWRGNPGLPFAEWKKQFLDQLRETLVLPNALGLPSDPKRLARIDHGDFIEEQIEITLTPPIRSRAIVTIPKNGKQRHPALVLLHSMGSLVLYGKDKFLERRGEPAYLSEYRQELYGGRSLLADFARAGYLCIAIDAFGFSGRLQWASQNPDSWEEKRKHFTREEAEEFSLKIHREESELQARALGSLGLSIATVIAMDDVRTVDYLVSRPDVDPDRIGCAGLSFGSFRANYLVALDERIRAAASVCWISTLDGIVDYNIPLSLGFFAIPGEMYRHFDIIDIPIAAAPKPFLAMSGWDDILMEPSGTASAHLSLRRAWKAAGHPENLGSLVFNASHEFNLPMQNAALKFFGKFL